MTSIIKLISVRIIIGLKKTVLCYSQKPLYFYAIALVIISLLVFSSLLDFGIHKYADWGYQYPETLRTYLTPSIWLDNFNFGTEDVAFWRTPYNIFSGLFGLFNLGSNIRDWFLVFLPLAITSALAPLFLLRKILKDDIAAFCGTLVFSFNTYFLAISSQGQMLLQLAANVALIGFSLAIDAYGDRDISKYVWAALAFSMAGFIDFRILYLSLPVVLCLFIFGAPYKTNKTHIHFLMALLVILLLLTLFWVLPFSFDSSLTNNAALNRSLFGNEFWSLPAALALFHPFWTGAKPEWFHVQQIPFYLWTIPVLVVGGLAIARKRAPIIIWLVLALVGIILAKQVDKPFSTLYPWLFAHIPGFSAFREATKFYFFIALGYSVLIGDLVKRTFELSRRNAIWRYASVLICGAILTVTALNVAPAISGSIMSLYSSRNLPSDYAKLNEFLARSSFARSFWVPSASGWATLTSKQPRVDGSIVDSDWAGFIDPMLKKGDSLIDQRIAAVFTQTYSMALFQASSIKYVVVPIRDNRNDDDFFPSYGNNRQFYIDMLNQIPWLKKIDIGAKELVVYENSMYASNFSAQTSLFSLSSVNNLAGIYNFTESQLNSHILSFTSDAKKIFPSTKVKDPFADLTPGAFNAGAITVGPLGNGNGAGQLYANTNHHNLHYQTSNDSFTLYSANNSELFTNGSVVNGVEPEKMVMANSMSTDREYYINSDNGLTPIGRNQTGNLGSANGGLSLYSTSNTNLIANPSLEAGLWQKRVDDCNNYDFSGEISMLLDKDHFTDGRQSLKLSANMHTACTGPSDIPIIPGGEYRLVFDYMVEGGAKAGYIVSFNDEPGTVIKDYMNVGDNTWRKFSRTIKAPPGATHMSLKVLGIPSSQNGQTATSNYDNFALEPLTLEHSLEVDNSPRYQIISLAANDTLTIKDQKFSITNQIPDPSFEKKLWQDKVGDCNAYDPNPSIAMKRNLISATSGKASLELDATRHTACTGPPPLTVEANNKYYLSFDYSSTNAANAGYYVGFNDPAGTVISERLPITSHKWAQFSKIMTAPIGATSATLLVYSYADDLGEKKVSTLYDNFRFINIPDIQGQYYVVSSDNLKLHAPKSINSAEISPTNKNIHIKGATTSFYLNMSERYHDKWRLEFNNNKARGLLASWVPWAEPDDINAIYHYQLDGFANGWYIDVNKLCKQDKLCALNPDGSYDMEMIAEYTPQRWFYVGLVISGVTLLGCVGYLGWSWRRSRRKT